MVGSWYRDNDLLPPIPGVDALDCVSVPLAKADERENLGKSVEIGNRQGHGKIKYAKKPWEEATWHYLGLGDVQPVYLPRSPGAQHSEWDPFASLRTQSILAVNEYRRGLGSAATRTANSGSHTFLLRLLQHHRQIKLSNPFWLPKERVQVEPVSLARVQVIDTPGRGSKTSECEPVLVQVQDERELCTTQDIRSSSVH